MRITSWNINSLKARRPHVDAYLKDPAPDVLMVQELKGLDFPHDEFKALGYHTAAVTQKTYNGVAIFSKTPIETLLEKLPGDDSDEQARYIEFETNGVRLINVYCPNGNPVFNDDGTFHEKYTYKLAWMKRLQNRLQHLLQENIPFAIGGDFNVIPEAKDCHNANAWKEDALHRIETLKTYRTLINLGLTEAFRAFNNQDEQYTFWDYQRGAWQKNDGIRIDHFLLSPHLADRLQNCTIDKTPRGWDRPSDHTPISITLESPRESA